jgi:hypothetical protein
MVTTLADALVEIEPALIATQPSRGVANKPVETRADRPAWAVRVDHPE